MHQDQHDVNLSSRNSASLIFVIGNILTRSTFSWNLLKIWIDDIFISFFLSFWLLEFKRSKVFRNWWYTEYITFNWTLLMIWIDDILIIVFSCFLTAVHYTIEGVQEQVLYWAHNLNGIDDLKCLFLVIVLFLSFSVPPPYYIK